MPCMKQDKVRLMKMKNLLNNNNNMSNCHKKNNIRTNQKISYPKKTKATNPRLTSPQEVNSPPTGKKESTASKTSS